MNKNENLKNPKIYIISRMTELTYDIELERLRLEAHNDRKAPEYAILCDLSGVDGLEENEDLYLRGAAELEMHLGLAEALFEEYSPKDPSPEKTRKNTPSKLTKKELCLLPLSDLLVIWTGLAISDPSEKAFDPGHGCRTNKSRTRAYASAIYRHIH